MRYCACAGGYSPAFAAMIVDGILEPMELAHLPYKHGKTFEQYVGAAALKRVGRKKWQHAVDDGAKSS